MDPYRFLLDVVREAGFLLLDARRKGFRVDVKRGDPRDIVTSADRAVNRLLLGKIKKAFPEHDVYSEEEEEEEGRGECKGRYLWIIDPIDGSANFSRGIPHFSVCVGLMEKGVPILGAVYNPVTDELFSFKKGEGAFLNGHLIRVSSISDLSEAHVLFHAGRNKSVRDWGGESYRRLLGSVKKTSNLAASTLDACFVAAGRVEANVYGTLSTLDAAPALGILYEARGIACDAAGGEVRLSPQPRKIYMANNQKMLNQVYALLES